MTSQINAKATNTVKRFFYFPTGRQMWFDIADELDRKNIATPVLWLGDDRHIESAKKRFPEADVVSFKKISQSKIVPGQMCKSFPREFWESDEYFFVRDQALKLMQREDHSDAFSVLERDAFFHELILWAADRVSYLQPDALIMAETPHSAPQYVIYAVAKAMGIRVFSFVSCPTVPGLLLQSGISADFFTFTETADRRQRFNDLCENEIKGYLASFSEDGYGFLPRYMKIQANLEGTSRNVKLQILSRQIRQYTRLVSPIRARGAIKRKKLKVALHRYAVDTPNEQYVYFPLHYEPERTTTPDGGIFHDQIRALAFLRALVPANIKIVVKEHPSIFNAFMYGHLGRHARHYAIMNKMSGVVLVPTEVSSAELLRGCTAIATITGTVGIEGAALGKPVLVFGNPWYKSCPSVVKYSPNLDWNDFITKGRPDFERLREWFLSVPRNYLLPGTMNPSDERYFNSWYSDKKLYTDEIEEISHALQTVLQQ